MLMFACCLIQQKNNFAKSPCLLIAGEYSFSHKILPAKMTAAWVVKKGSYNEEEEYGQGEGGHGDY